eukprot:8636167-Alexandrium_andersonii.AAC.1
MRASDGVANTGLACTMPAGLALICVRACPPGTVACLRLGLRIRVCEHFRGALQRCARAPTG